MDKNQIAIYLNEHPEFFNEYPDLLQKIKMIEQKDLPLEPLKTLSIADRILKRANDDKEHMRSKLEWFVEITQANEKIQEHLFEIERAILSSMDFDQMILNLREEISKRFDFKEVIICLVDGEDHFIEDRLQERFDDCMECGVKFVEQETVSGWFKEGIRPILNGELEEGEAIFNQLAPGMKIESEAFIPLVINGKVAGAICMGSANPLQFKKGQRAEYLERTAEKIALSIDNLLLLDRLRHQPVRDKLTGLYNVSYLEPVLRREFDKAARDGKHLSCIKIRVDYFNDLVNTCDETDLDSLRVKIGALLTQNSRTGDIVIRSARDEFLVLLPDISFEGASEIAGRIRKSLDGKPFEGLAESHLQLGITTGVATFPDDSVVTKSDLVQAASKALVQAREVKPLEKNFH